MKHRVFTFKTASREEILDFCEKNGVSNSIGCSISNIEVTTAIGTVSFPNKELEDLFLLMFAENLI